nr:immunoglobulin heavy chain junction region [Mus musculus]
CARRGYFYYFDYW